MIPVKVLKISYHPTSRSYAVILKELTGDRCLPVIVGSFEAQSIALAIEVVETPRPLTHDLICDIITSFDVSLKAIKINDVNDGIFFAQIEFLSEKNGEQIIDARPSDAIAVALRMNTPILVSKKVFNEAAVEEKSLVKGKEPRKIQKKEPYTLRGLKDKLKKAVEEEEYEVAAKIRDKIIKLDLNT